MTNSLNIQALIDTAATIAAHKHEEGLAPKFCISQFADPDSVEKIINSALQGHGLRGPHMWAVILDTQEAARLLDLADRASTRREALAEQDYRAAANRKLAEAVSWLM